MDIVINVLLYAIIIYLVINIFTMNKRNKKGKLLNELISCVEKKDEFFEKAKADLEGIHDAEYENKIRIIELWGMAYHKEFDEFESTLNAVDLNVLIKQKRGRADIEMNEDAFFYMYVYIPFLLYLDGRKDMREKLKEKMSALEETLKDQLLCEMSKHLEDFYENRDDRGLAYYENVLNGNYDGFRYLKRFISLYKEILNAFAARIYLDNNDQDKYAECEPLLNDFRQYRIGSKYIKGLHLPEPAKTEEEKEAEKAEADDEEKFNLSAPAEDEKEEPAAEETKEETAETEESKEEIPAEKEKKDDQK
jgi:hypothetical protein